MRRVNPGFEPHGVITASAALPRVRYAQPRDVTSFFDRALSSLLAIPGVDAAAMASVVPLDGDFGRTGYVIEGRASRPGEQISPDRYIVSPDYMFLVGFLRVIESRTPGGHVCFVSTRTGRSNSATG